MKSITTLLTEWDLAIQRLKDAVKLLEALSKIKL